MSAVKIKDKLPGKHPSFHSTPLNPGSCYFGDAEFIFPEVYQDSLRCYDVVLDLHHFKEDRIKVTVSACPKDKPELGDCDIDVFIILYADYYDWFMAYRAGNVDGGQIIEKRVELITGRKTSVEEVKKGFDFHVPTKPLKDAVGKLKYGVMHVVYRRGSESRHWTGLALYLTDAVRLPAPLIDGHASGDVNLSVMKHTGWLINDPVFRGHHVSTHVSTGSGGTAVGGSVGVRDKLRLHMGTQIELEEIAWDYEGVSGKSFYIATAMHDHGLSHPTTFTWTGSLPEP